MYTEKERAKLLIQAATVVSTYPEVEGIVQVGSGVEGFLDEYSDIDLIFSTFTSQQVPGTARADGQAVQRCAVYPAGRPGAGIVFVCLFKEWAGI